MSEQISVHMEVHAMAGKLLEFAETNIACSREVLVAALKVAATIVEEASQADNVAQIRANMQRKFR